MIQIFENLLNATIVSSIIICVFLLFKTNIFKMFNKKFNYYIWLIPIFKMLFFTFSYSLFIENQALIDRLDTYSNTSTNNTLLFCLSLIWLFVALFFLVRILIKYNKQKSLLIDLSDEINIIEINSIFENLKAELNIKQNVTLRLSYDISSPCVIGLFKPHVLLTDSFKTDELYWVLKHELTHIKNKDILVKFTIAFLRCLYWFNPLVYLMSKKINEDCELHCDERVIENSSKEEQRLYGLTLINSAKLNNVESYVLITEFYKTNLEKRLDNIIHIKTKNGILIVLILCLLSSITYLKFESISTDSLVQQIHKEAPIKTRENSKPRFSIQFNTDDY